MDEEPLVRVTKGTPTPEEVAALVGVLTWRYRTVDATAGPGRPAPSAWSRSALPGTAVRPGPDGWRSSALPR